MPHHSETNNTLTNVLEPFLKLGGVSTPIMGKIRTLCGLRYIDILLHIPTGYTDRRTHTTIAEAPTHTDVVLKVKIESHTPSPRYKRTPWKIIATDSTGTIELIFFNGGKWLEKKFPTGEEVYLTGKVDTLLTEKQMHHPEGFNTKTPLTEIACILANYPLTSGVGQTSVRKAVGEAYQALGPDITEWLPQEFLKQRDWPKFNNALKTLHTPAELNQKIEKAKNRLSFDELLAWQLALLKTRQNTKKEPGFSHKAEGNLKKALLAALPFALTGDQQKVSTHIEADLEKKEPMLRLLQGDVGAGKTIVAFLAALPVLENNKQVAMMAPTEILAIQHYENAKSILEPLGIKCALLKGKMPAKAKGEVHEAIQNGNAQMVFGTHALIQKKVIFNALGLAIIDEQHRFGVRQRLALSGGENSTLQPDVLVMTATPIPRTLALTTYGDMDISLLKEKPPGRTPIKTTVMAAEKTKSIAYALKRIIEKGEQAYWVCPLVDESEKSDLAAATKRFEALSKLYPNQVVLLHGKMKPTEKEEIMQAFKAGKYKVMVATTVIEVGVDVPQATTMVIEHAERFGLAQLHQLRGRVGRGSQASHCILLYTAPLGKTSTERLNIMRQTEDGFLIAEKDYELRGPGEMLGTQQAGHHITRIANLANTEMVLEARTLAEELIVQDKPELDILLEIFNKNDAQNLVKSG